MSVASDRRQLRSAIAAGDAAMNRIYAHLAPRVRAIVEANATKDDELTPAGRKRAMRQIDRLLDEVFPARRGGPSITEAAIVAHSRRAADQVVENAVREVERADPELAAVLQREATNARTTR